MNIPDWIIVLSLLMGGYLVGYSWGCRKTYLQFKSTVDEVTEQSKMLQDDLRKQINEVKIVQKTYVTRIEDYDIAIKFFYSQEH